MDAQKAAVPVLILESEIANDANAGNGFPSLQCQKRDDGDEPDAGDGRTRRQQQQKKEEANGTDDMEKTLTQATVTPTCSVNKVKIQMETTEVRAQDEPEGIFKTASTMEICVQEEQMQTFESAAPMQESPNEPYWQLSIQQEAKDHRESIARIEEAQRVAAEAEGTTFVGGRGCTDMNTSHPNN